MQVDEAFFAENTFLVDAEHARNLEITVDGAIPYDFLHHFLLGSCAPPSADKVRLLDLGDGLTLLMVLAAIPLSIMLVR